MGEGRARGGARLIGRGRGGRDQVREASVTKGERVAVPR